MTSIFFFVQCIIKQLLDSVFVISRIIKVSDNPYLDLDYSGYQKTSNNSLKTARKLQQCRENVLDVMSI